MEPAAMSIVIPHMNPALYRAAAAGTLEHYLKALEQMTAQEVVDCQVAPNGNTVLHVAVLHGNKHVVDQILQEQKAQASASSMLYALNNKKESVLHCAAEKGDADIVSALIKAIKEYSKYSRDLESGVSGVIEMIHKEDVVKDVPLHKAARMGHLGVVKLLIEEDNEFLNPSNAAGETPIYLAAESEFFYCLKEMIKKCQTLTCVIGPLGRNVLHAAILSRSGINSTCVDTAFVHMIGRAPSLWEKLMQNFGRHAGKVDKAGCVQLILEKEISLSEMTDSLGWTPLHYAVKFGDDETVRKILERKRSAAYIRAGKDDDWTTIFHIAVRHSNIKMMECISNSLPDCWAMINCKSQNVLHEAILSGERNMVKYILKYPQYDNLVDQKDKDGNTPLHLIPFFRWSPVDLNHIVPQLKPEHLVFNKWHQTPLDVCLVASQREVYSAFNHVSGGIPQRMIGRRSGPRALFKIKETCREDTDNNDIEKKRINGYLRISKTMTLVATLILTLSFAAGFAVPGGYNSNQGYPILLRKSAFRHFVIVDTAAFVSSVSAIFIYMIMVSINSCGSISESIIIFATLCASNTTLTVCALTAVVAEFFIGMNAILAPLHSLVVNITSISFYLFFFPVFGYYITRKFSFPFFNLLSNIKFSSCQTFHHIMDYFTSPLVENRYNLVTN